eukprot:gene3618-biopygen5312
MSSQQLEQEEPQQQQQQRRQQQQQQQQEQPMQQLGQQLQQKQQPSVAKAKQLLYRRLKVVLTSGRVIEGDLACLDKQGNLILGNAVEHIAIGSSDLGNGSSSGSAHPLQTSLGMVLVPKAEQQDVLLQVTLSEKAAMLSLTTSA